MKLYFELFITFFKIGAFTFGGGYAMIPIIQRELVDKKHWLKENDILDIFAISESTPGLIAINCSTFVGYKIGGFFGSLIATVSLVIPPFIIILILSYFIEYVENLTYVKYAFWGIRIGIMSLMIKALISMVKTCPKNAFAYILMGLAFLTSVIFTGLNVIYIIIACGLIGIAAALITGKFKKEVK